MCCVTTFRSTTDRIYNGGIKINRLKWAGHVICTEEQSAIRRVLVAVVEGRRQRGRPKLRWEDGVMGDARKLGGEKLGGMLQGIGTAGRSFWSRLWLKKGCCADDDDDDDDDDYSTYSSFLVINVCNQGKTLCSPCTCNKLTVVYDYIILSFYNTNIFPNNAALFQKIAWMIFQ